MSEHTLADPIIYNDYIQSLRKTEFTSLSGQTYLDHAGTALYPTSLIQQFSTDLTASIYGNPHSGSSAAQESARRVEDVRHAALQFFGADPDHFDLVFVANATAGAKLVGEAFRDACGGFWYGYHRDCHTSLVGLREWATAGQNCFKSDDTFDVWIDNMSSTDRRTPDAEFIEEEALELICYPAQSNMNGRRLPQSWCERIRTSAPRRYTLLDAAAYASSSPLNFASADAAPDFTILSFNKTFGFPNLGAVIVRKASADVLLQRKYFGGGTVDLALCTDDNWHAKKKTSIHAALEDGTLPFHNILALGHAMKNYDCLYNGIESVSKHVTWLTHRLYNEMRSLRHSSGRHVCRIFKDDASTYGDAATQGPTIAFHLQNEHGILVNNAEVEKLASISNIHLRTGGLCNPGGMSTSLGLSATELRNNYASGYRCSQGANLASGRPAGMIRVSLGAMSTLGDVETFLAFVRDFFVHSALMPGVVNERVLQRSSRLYIENLNIYPIKSCGAYNVPPSTPWSISSSGLAYDREWCLVHASTGNALSMKQYPRMTLFRPVLDLEQKIMTITFTGELNSTQHLPSRSITIPMSLEDVHFNPTMSAHAVHDTSVTAFRYADKSISTFFSAVLGVPCHLVRCCAARSCASNLSPSKHRRRPIESRSQSTNLANESPILTITRASLNALNLELKAKGEQAVAADRFRANIVIAEQSALQHEYESVGKLGISEQAWAEDEWAALDITSPSSTFCQNQQQQTPLSPAEPHSQVKTTVRLNLGLPCRRCAMICVDPSTAQKGREPFATLARIRRRNGLVVFGRHGSCEGEGVVGVGDEISVGRWEWEDRTDGGRV